MENIKITGAYENNLKHISLEIPKKRITIFTGVSGSGKSSLVLDTIAASSRRELNETFPSFVQQYLPKYGRPHVDKIEHLPGRNRDRPKEASSQRPLYRGDLHRHLFSAPVTFFPRRQAFCRLFRHVLLQSSARKMSPL